MCICIACLHDYNFLKIQSILTFTAFHRNTPLSRRPCRRTSLSTQSRLSLTTNPDSSRCHSLPPHPHLSNRQLEFRHPPAPQSSLKASSVKVTMRATTIAKSHPFGVPTTRTRSPPTNPYDPYLIPRPAGPLPKYLRASRQCRPLYSINHPSLTGHPDQSFNPSKSRALQRPRRNQPANIYSNRLRSRLSHSPNSIPCDLNNRANILPSSILP